MKILSKIIGAVASLAMVVAPIAVSGAASAVTPASPNTVTITKQVTGVTNAVNNTFNYQIEQDGFNNPATVTLPETTFEIKFNNTAPVNNIATATHALDFSQVDFPKVGDYYFKITETTSNWSSDEDNVYPRDESVWWAYVSVRYVMAQDGVTPTSQMEASVAQVGYKGANGGDYINGDDTVTPEIETNKAPITFETTPEMTYIELDKKVTGNLGDITHPFEYTINLGAKMANKTLSVLGTYSDASGANTTGPITTNASGVATLYLKHDQAIKIGLTDTSASGIAQIPLKATASTNNQYTITETPETVDTFNPQAQYKIYIDGTLSANGVSTKTLAAMNSQDFDTNNKTTYTNNKEAEPITGFFINYWPFILLIVLAAVGAVIFKKTSKKVNK